VRCLLDSAVKPTLGRRHWPIMRMTPYPPLTSARQARGDRTNGGKDG
jgi:hypothetical protein